MQHASGRKRLLYSPELKSEHHRALKKKNTESPGAFAPQNIIAFEPGGRRRSASPEWLGER